MQASWLWPVHQSFVEKASSCHWCLARYFLKAKKRKKSCHDNFLPSNCYLTSGFIVKIMLGSFNVLGLVHLVTSFLEVIDKQTKQVNVVARCEVRDTHHLFSRELVDVQVITGRLKKDMKGLKGTLKTEKALPYIPFRLLWLLSGASHSSSTQLFPHDVGALGFFKFLGL